MTGIYCYPLLLDFPMTFFLIVLGLIIVPDPLYKKKTWWRTEKER